jgi:plasmid stabilization system protein ParE
MGFKIVFTKPAIPDLDGLARFIAGDNPRAAVEFGNAKEGLGEFPFLGRVVPEFKIETIRDIVHRPYRIVYRVFEILRVWHAARGTPNIWHTAGM